ncbi:SigE family RNA polymerase sigma factor [Nonomuraea sp. SBT364]|uniref:SigE family RNA polymerase sigma factor n=1 Tax=Nonomuraea sp. SBT364 TaxID=1580530 RepID=UPI00066C084D|nr:SigE family RNA polymerase sigma factor [Nonomuraea sp. SBT364]
MTDSEAYEAFVAAWYPRLLRAAILISGDRHLAEDVLQDALIKLARRWPKVHTDPAGYVRTTLYRDVATRWRRRREFAYGDPPDRADPGSSAESDLKLMFARALARLPVRQRAVLVLRFYEDLPVIEVAAILRVSAGTVKSQTHAALKRLREVAPELEEVST